MLKIITSALYMREEGRPVLRCVVYKDNKFLLVGGEISHELLQDIYANNPLVVMENVVSEFQFNGTYQLTKEEVDEIYKDFFDSPTRNHPDNEIQDEAKRFLLELRREMKLNKLGI